MQNIGTLRQWRRGMVTLAAASGEPMIGSDMPRFWCTELSFACAAGHVSLNYLNDEGAPRCFECRAPVVTVPPPVRESNIAHFLEGPRYWTRTLDETGALALVTDILALRGESPAPALSPVLFDQSAVLWPVMRGAQQIAVLRITKFDDREWPGWTVELNLPSV